jgi:hypothetical protein
LAQALDAK